jgi:hypothetical protein
MIITQHKDKAEDKQQIQDIEINLILEGFNGIEIRELSNLLFIHIGDNETEEKDIPMIYSIKLGLLKEIEETILNTLVQIYLISDRFKDDFYFNLDMKVSDIVIRELRKGRYGSIQ